MLDKLAHRTLASAIAARLRQDILAGRLEGGTQLRQDALAETYGVSRIPVREALLQMETEGLVRIQPHRGAVVSSLSVAEVRDVFELRIILEPRLFGASVPHWTQEDHEILDRTLGEFSAELASGQVGRSGELNAAFHMALYARADLPRTTAIVASLLQTSDRYTRLQLSSTAALDRAQREHEELLALARSGPIEAATDFLIDHIAAVRDDLLRVISEGRAEPARQSG